MTIGQGCSGAFAGGGRILLDSSEPDQYRTRECRCVLQRQQRPSQYILCTVLIMPCSCACLRQHSLVYWVRGFIPPSLVDADPAHIGLNEVLVALRFGDPKTPSQPPYNSTFSTLLKGLSPSFQLVMNMKYEETSAGVTAFFPEGFRRLFEGPVVSTISKSFLDKLATRMDQYINESLAKGDPPASAIYALQYVSPTHCLQYS